MEEEAVILTEKAENGELLEAIFLPNKGMNLISYRKGASQIIDQSTKDLFEQRYAGLGAMIGPHFHHRNAAIIPIISDESLFPHIQTLRQKGVIEPFSHGIGRYAPWKHQFDKNSIQAILEGKDQWKGVSLADLEGQNFVMEYKAALNPHGLKIELSVVSDTDSVVGLHTYYKIPKNGHIVSNVEPLYNDQGELKEIPSSWNYNSSGTLKIDLDGDIDFGFFPKNDPLSGEILLNSDEYQVKVGFQCNNQENSWQLWHPKGHSFVCIEPLTAKNPKKPILSVNSITIFISIQSIQAT